MTGSCTTCRRFFKLRNGKVVFHRQRDVWSTDFVGYTWPQPPCPGWGKTPGETA